MEMIDNITAPLSLMPKFTIILVRKALKYNSIQMYYKFRICKSYQTGPEAYSIVSNCGPGQGKMGSRA